MISVLSLAILVLAVLVISCSQTQTESQTDKITDVDQRYTHVTTVGVSN